MHTDPAYFTTRSSTGQSEFKIPSLRGFFSLNPLFSNISDVLKSNVSVQLYVSAFVNKTMSAVWRFRVDRSCLFYKAVYFAWIFF